MTRLRRQFGLLVVVSGMVTALYIAYLNPRHLFGLSRNVILVQSDLDVCDTWATAYPTDTIIVIASQLLFKNPNCYYVKKEYSSIKAYVLALKFQPHLVIVTNGNQKPASCSLGAATRRPTIIYSREDDHIFNSSAHWGYGGIDHDDPNTKYHFSSDLDSPVLSVMTTKFAPAGCKDVYPPMVLGRGAYVRTQHTCLVLTRKAFWALPLMGDSSTGKERTALSLLAQKLVWDSGQLVEHLVRLNSDFAGPIPNSDVDIEKTIIGYLKNFSCAQNATFMDCLMKTAQKLAELNYITGDKLQVLKQWISIVPFAKHEYPVELKNENMKGSEIKSYLSKKDNFHERSARALDGPSTCSFYLNKLGRITVEKDICKTANVSSLPPWIQWKNILLIVSFNTPTYESIPLYETLYRPFFPHIVYCGSEYPNMTTQNLKEFSFPFISFGKTPTYLNKGSLNYQCLIDASRLGYKVDGYFQVADDVLLLPHRLQYFNTSKVWTWRLDNMVRVNYENDSFCDDAGCRAEDVPFWFTHKNNTLRALSALQLQNQSSTIKACAKNIANLYGGPKWSLRILSDITYVPNRLISEITELLQMFQKHEVYLEIAIPTVLHCIVPQNDIQPIYTHFHNMLAPNQTVEYSPLIAEPHQPDLVLMAHREYVNRDKAWDQANGRLFNGITFFHPHKMKHASNHLNFHAEFFCRLLRFYGDRTANLTSAMTSEVVVNGSNRKKKKKQHKKKKVKDRNVG